LKGWIDEAVDGGAKLLCGGQLDGAFLSATVLENAPLQCKVCVSTSLCADVCVGLIVSFD
jgi:acyl-CoA reductase-like NAD-dependent aldehyde dehydrogenase